MNARADTTNMAEKAIDVLRSLLSWQENIEEALRHADYSHTFDDITAMVMRGDLMFHNFEDCFCLTQITVFPQFKTYHFMVAGGELNGIINRKSKFEAIAKECGCKYLSFSGRPGWLRALKSKGWKHKFTTMWSEIEQ
jgi:hypothetical protein